MQQCTRAASRHHAILISILSPHQPTLCICAPYFTFHFGHISFTTFPILPLLSDIEHSIVIIAMLSSTLVVAILAIAAQAFPWPTWLKLHIFDTPNLVGRQDPYSSTYTSYGGTRTLPTSLFFANTNDVLDVPTSTTDSYDSEYTEYADNCLTANLVSPDGTCGPQTPYFEYCGSQYGYTCVGYAGGECCRYVVLAAFLIATLHIRYLSFGSRADVVPATTATAALTQHTAPTLFPDSPTLHPS